ncbi:MAG TPA: amidohydrolase [Gemmatimonadaceae bacterium]|nr:amidohydrolase [Gemmatimonadaceae bacterium]
MSSAPVTLALVNARVWTADARRPWAEAVAVSGDRIVAVGSSAEVQKLAGPETRVVDAAGRMVVPGFFDSHLHFVDGGHTLASVQLRDAPTPAEFVRRIREFAASAPPGTWITGGNWDHENWGGELPTRQWIDSVTQNNPVWINRLDGHMSLANGLALAAAGVTSATADVEGGVIERTAQGEPTGILKDNAKGLVSRVVPPVQPDIDDHALDAAMNYVAALGITSVVNMGDWNDVDVFRRAHGTGRLRTRIYAAVPLSSWSRLRDEVAANGRGDYWLRIGGLKAYVDGSLGSRTAAMLQPYNDAPDEKGVFVTRRDSLYEWTRDADAAGLHVMVHAIGDAANRMQLDIFEQVARENGVRDRRSRIEHAQHLNPADVPRFAALGVIASMQPYHAIDDGRWAGRRVGPHRIGEAYVFRSLVDSRARLAFGSDWDVEPATPLGGIYAAVTRRTLDNLNPGGWVPEQKISVEEALRAYTIDAAYAEFTEREKGSLEVGKLADMVLLDRDITRVPPETIRDARVLLTVVGGRVVHEAAP